jgi:GH25 family lysozyme M1 (1,4-beta-N-acetylmuramidase)
MALGALLAAGPASAAPQPGSDTDNGWAGHGAPRGLTGGMAAIAPQPAGYPINGIDVSSNDHASGKTVNWAAQKAGGDEFAYVKATEGTSYVNPFFNQDYNGAKNVGLYTGAYAWGRPDLGNAVGQANHFVDQMQWSTDGRTLPPFLDIEWPYSQLNLPACYGVSQAAMRSWISSFLGQVKARIGTTPMIYTNVNWWNPCTGSSAAFGEYLLDISSCNSAPPSVPGWGTNWTFWQYEIDACERGAKRDYDVFNGTLADLAALAGGTAPVSSAAAGQAVVHEGYTSVFTVNAADGHLQETFLARVGGAWATQDLSAAAGTPSVAGQPVTVVHDGLTSVFTVNASNGHLQETFLARVGGAWVTQDLGAVAVGQTPSVSVHDGFVSVFTVTAAGQIQETYLSRLGAAWVTQPLPGAAVAPYTSVVTHDGYVSVFAVTTGGRVQETYLARLGVAWVTQDLGAAAVAQAPSVVMHDGYVSVFTVTAAGRIQETYLARLGTAWVTQALPGSAVKPATSAVVHDGYVSVFAATTGGRLQETYLARLGTAWVAQDLNANPGTPLMAGRPVTVTHDGYTSVFTVNATGGHVQETYLPRVGAAWTTQDLTTTAGTPAAKP